LTLCGATGDHPSGIGVSPGSIDVRSASTHQAGIPDGRAGRHEADARKISGHRDQGAVQDMRLGLLTALFRSSPGSVLPDHEQSYLLEGSIEEQGEEIVGNSVARPVGSRHVARSRSGALLLAVFMEPNRFFAADGNSEQFSTRAGALIAHS
jgi:hypothetical protein